MSDESRQLRRPRLSLGPVQYLWPRQQLLDFYDAVRDWPLDSVYLGETVCSKRRPLRSGEWLELARALEATGKQVVLSTLTLVEAESELLAMRRLCENGHFMVEANDMAAVRMLSGRGLRFATGPSVNIYNPASLRYLAGIGLARWVLPVELSRESLRDFQAERPRGVETELFAYGRLPLAYSARCFSARARNLGKDDCGLCCEQDPDGQLIQTRENEPFLALNGIQTQSALTFSLLEAIDEARELDVDLLRISPQSAHTGEVVAAFDAALQGTPAATRKIDSLMPVGPCNGYWYGEAGLALTARCVA